MSVRLRSYRPADRACLVSVINTVCAECEWMFTRRFEPTPGWTHALAQPDCTCHLLIVAEDTGIFGWCRLLPGTGTLESLELGIGLLPEYRKHGIGTTLVQSSLAWASLAGYRRVTLGVHPHNLHARHVFASCGFQDGVGDQWQLVMTCDL